MLELHVCLGFKSTAGLGLSLVLGFLVTMSLGDYEECDSLPATLAAYPDCMR